ncbi:MAG: NAD(P)/FAD-dependent oxidoreductase [Coriobacteriales bacterium]|jgi:2,4-dienoyl-CoA reductase-like NADH-dependent reductase (Old Yellow Enzyme family)/thioredoxin reductase|nr:NAD(P)/FAD-dependent oxidoreductase [Coriobacteriales bacterium]
MAFSTAYPHVFSPLQIGPITAKNRIQFSPLVCNMVGPAGEVTQDFIDWIDLQAATGAGVVTIGATPVDVRSGADYYAELNVTDDVFCTGLVRLADTAHIHGAKLSVELLHAGRGADPQLLQLPEALSASSIPLPDRPRYVKEMDHHDIDHIVECYVDCAKRLQRCRFDMVLIHAAHSNLLAQFLSPVTNHRTDWYGGSFENRARFPLAVLAAVREAVGPNMAIDMRISGNEHVPGGMEIEEVIAFIKLAQEYIDIVHVSAGWITDQHAQFFTMPPYYRPRGVNVPLARAVKDDPDIRIPVTTVGSIKTLEHAERIIAEGSADQIAMARALLCDPELIRKSYRGAPETVRPCLRCWGCADTYGAYTTCAINPALGKTGRYRSVVPAQIKKRAVVVGGGVAGMMAARTLKDRGHEVVLFEQTPRLGGLLNEISSLSFKEDQREYLEWVTRTTLHSGVDIRFGVKATADVIRAENPDLLFIATGSTLLTPPIPGIDKPHVANVLDVDNGRVVAGERVVVCGGGVSGLECALELALEGRTVTVVDMVPVAAFAADFSGITRSCLLQLLADHQVELIGGSRVVQFTDDGVEIEDHDWRHRVLAADTCVTAFGTVADAALVEELSGLLPDVFVVGDAAKPSNIKAANNAAYCLAAIA